MAARRVARGGNALAAHVLPAYADATLGALRGNLTFSRFFVTGDVPRDLAGTSLKRIRAQALRPLSPEEDVTSRHGWASVEDPFDTDLDHEKVFFNEYVVLAMRVDAWVVPGPLLKSHLREAEQALLQRKGLERLGRKAKAELKLFVLKKLRRQLVPATKSIDLVWNVNTNVACFFSHAKKMHEQVQELFEKTFRLRLLVESPATAANRGAPQTAKAFAALEPTSLGPTLEEAS